MLRIFYFIFVCLIIYIPHTSIQDELISNENHHYISRRETKKPTIKDSITSLIQSITEQQYQYETVYYALALNNVLPNFAKLFHERSEQKYKDVKGLIRLCQILNIDINLTSISASPANEPLKLLSSDRINKTNFAQYFTELKEYECKTIFTRLSSVYQGKSSMIIPIRMYFKEKVFMKQLLTCKITTDLYVQLDRFIDRNSQDPGIPFSFMFMDSRAKIMLSK